jgi:hypothetical protein
MVVTLFVGGDTEVANAARSVLSRLPGIKIRVRPWSSASRIRVLLPFLESSQGVRYYGLTAITSFVNDRLLRL